MGEMTLEMEAPVEPGTGIWRLWDRRSEVFSDIRSDEALWNAIRDSILLPGEGNEWVSVVITQAMADLLYDDFAPGGIRSPANVSDAQLASAGLSREQLEYWVARERIGAVEIGLPVDHFVPPVRLRPISASRGRRLLRCAPRARAARRRAPRSARAPDDPSRPSRSQITTAGRRPRSASA